MNRKVLIYILVTVFTIPLIMVSTSAKNAKDPKILVIYYSRTGITKQVAEDIANKLNADIEQVIDMKDRSGFTGYIGGAKDAKSENITPIGEMKKNPAEYDCIVIGTPIWAWTITPAIRTYIQNNKNSLKKTVFFTTAGSTTIDKIIPIFENAAGQKAIASEGFTKKDFTKENKDAYDKKIDAFASRIVDEIKKAPAN
jgi:flavodoxin